MYPVERFTEDASRVLTHAQEEAERSQHGFVGTEHVLLALLAQESEASRILGQLGVEPADVRQVLKAVLGRIERLNIQRIIPTSRVKKVIELAFATADGEGRTSISPVHLLLGLLREGEGIAARVLSDRHVTVEKVMALRSPVEPDAEAWPPPGSRVLVHDPDPPYRLWEGAVTGHEAGEVVVSVPQHPDRPSVRVGVTALHRLPLSSSGACELCLAPSEPASPRWREPVESRPTGPGGEDEV
jgi:hypothetical protein